MTTRLEILQKCRELEKFDPIFLNGIVAYLNFQIQCCKEDVLKKQQRIDNENVFYLADYREAKKTGMHI